MRAASTAALPLISGSGALAISTSVVVVVNCVVVLPQLSGKKKIME